MRKQAMLAFGVVTAFFAAGCSNGTTSNGVDLNEIIDGGGDDAPSSVDLTMKALEGTRFFTGNGLQLAGMTPDDYVIFLDSKNAANAVKVSGGAAVAITPRATLFTDVRVSSHVVFAGSNVDMQTRLGDLFAWVPGGSAVQLNQKGQSWVGPNQVVASDDNQYVMYTDNASGTSGDVYLAKVDGSGAKAIFTGVAFDTMGCVSNVGFAGGKFLVAHCPANRMIATISTVNPSDGVIKDVKENARSFVTSDDAGTKLFVTDTDQIGGMTVFGYVMDLDGSNVVQIDTDVFYGFPMPDGKAVVYGTNAPAMKRAPLPNPTPVTLATTNFNGFSTFVGERLGIALSYDNKFVITVTQRSAASSGITSLFLASTVTPAIPRPLVSSPTGCIFDDAFTTDSSHALYYSSCASQNNALIGTFQTLAIADGSKQVTIGTKVWNDRSTHKPTQVVYNDNWKPRSGTNGRADLKVTDVSAATLSPQLLATQAEADFFLTTARDKLVYAYAVDNATAGIYVVTIP